MEWSLIKLDMVCGPEPCLVLAHTCGDYMGRINGRFRCLGCQTKPPQEAIDVALLTGAYAPEFEHHGDIPALEDPSQDEIREHFERTWGRLSRD